MFKYNLAIPLPIGSKFYRINTDCCNACYFQKQLRKNISLYPDTIALACSSSAPCHTRFKGVIEEELTLHNLAYVIELWGTKIFETYEEAEAAGKALVIQHIKQMQTMGYAVMDDGNIEPAVIEAYKNDPTRFDKD